jgi:predicted amidohydrolase
MARGKIKIATAQFAVSKSITRNANNILKYMHKARQAGAEIVHFPECALSGYAGVDHKSLEHFDWDLLRQHTETILAQAAKLRLWIILGSHHPLESRFKPHNSLYLINPRGKIIDRYDKRFCTEDDLQHYSPGDHFVFFELNDVKCTLLICFDLRFPELYRALKKRNVQCVFQSFYNARLRARSVHTDIMRQTMQCRAATNHFWVSLTNSSAYYSSYPCCLIRPDGVITQQLSFHRPGLLIGEINTKEEFYDPSAPFRNSAMRGKLNSGRLVKSARSRRHRQL